MAKRRLLPVSDRLEVEQIISTTDSICVIVRAKGREARCPLCAKSSSRIHSRYIRTIIDLPWSNISVCLRLSSRRFFCDHDACPQRIFAERLKELVKPYGRHTNRLENALYLIGYSLGGEAGAKLALELGFTVSPDTLLRRVRKSASAPGQPTRFLGVDDWAWRKGQRYGTILVDLERQSIADLLPDSSGSSLSSWLRAHPEVEIIGRDRSQMYREGAKQGAPQARQVADRWHLLKNLGDSLERLLARRHRCLREAAIRASPPPMRKKGSMTTPTKPIDRPSPRMMNESSDRRQRRFQRYNAVMELYRSGASISSIASHLDLSRKTVRKWVRADGFPERAMRRQRPKKLDPFLSYLRQRWNKGCHNATQLFREIKGNGYTGSRTAVKEVLAPWRSSGSSNDQLASRATTVRSRRRVIPSPRTAMWFLIKETCQETDTKRTFREKFVQALKELSPEIAVAQELARQFHTLVRERHVNQLDSWITAVNASNIPELKSYAQGLLEDKEAVIGALSLDWSNGQVEGQIQRLKLIKRSMYGRANFELLRARVLPVAR